MTTAGRSRARRALAAALLAAVGGLAAAGGAHAQFYDREVDAILSPRAVIGQLNRQGFTPMGHPRFDGATYVVEAESSWGNRVRLFVDARSGAILDRERLEAPLYPPGRVGRPGYGWTEEEVVVARRPPMARPAPDGVPSNPFASNYPSRAPTREEMAAVAPPPIRPRALAPREVAPQDAQPLDANPQGLNPDRAGPVARQPARRAEPRRTAKLAPPKADAAPDAGKPADAAVKPAAPAAEAEKPSAGSKTTDAPKAVSEAAKPAPPAVPEASEAPRPVRVIGGVTPVPGAAADKTAKPAGE